jgi:hypothetical protein
MVYLRTRNRNGTGTGTAINNYGSSVPPQSTLTVRYLYCPGTVNKYRGCRCRYLFKYTYHGSLGFFEWNSTGIWTQWKVEELNFLACTVLYLLSTKSTFFLSHRKIWKLKKGDNVSQETRYVCSNSFSNLFLAAFFFISAKAHIMSI